MDTEPREMDIPSRPDPERDLDAVRAADGRGLYASEGENYRSAVFGRDSEEAAEDLLVTEPAITREVVLTLIRQQGVTTDLVTEEEPGKIHHEWRSRRFGGEIPEWQQQYWGGTEDEMCYYGTVDATPLFVRLAADYQDYSGLSIGNVSVERKDGRLTTVSEAITQATDWIVGRVETSSSGLLEYQATNQYGLKNQDWKDSTTATIHENGDLSNFDRPIAILTVQGLAYDALRKAGQLAGSPETQARWADVADQVQQMTLERLWMPEHGYFTTGLDYDASNEQPRQITTRSSNAGALLDSTLFDSLDDDRKRTYLTPVVERLFSADFLTEVGVRCRAVEHQDLVPLADYHGTWTVWGKETYDIAKGLHRQGLSRLAEELENRLLCSFELAGEHYELFYVNPDGDALYVPRTHGEGDAPPALVTNIPDVAQTWSTTAALAIRRRRAAGLTFPSAVGWRRDLEKHILEAIEPVSPTPGDDEVRAARQAVPFTLDEENGRRIQRKFVKASKDTPLP